MAAFRDRNGIMYFAPGGPVRSPYDTINTGGGYGGGYGQPPPQAVAGPPAPNPAASAGNPVPPPPPGTMGAGHSAGSRTPGLSAVQFGTNPYDSGIPLSNNFVAQTPTSNLSFGNTQYGAGLQQSGSTLGSLQGMLMNQANGGGPNPAAEQLKQSTNRNIAQAYALAQSSPNNAGAARNIAEQAGQINQQSASDAAQQRMQQQLAAQQQLGQLALGQYGTSGRLMTDAEQMRLQQAQGNQQAALNAQAINAQTSIGNQQYGANVVGSGINAAAAALGAGATALGSSFKGGQASGTTPTVGGSSGYYGDVTPAPDMSGAQGDFNAPPDYGGGETGYAAYGGMAPNFRHYADGGDVAPDAGPYVAPNYNPANYTDYSGKSDVDAMKRVDLLNANPRLNPYQPVNMQGAALQQQGLAGNGMGGWGLAPAFKTVVPIAMGYMGSAVKKGAEGGYVPGHAPVPGNSYDNDKIPAMLSAKEIVLPRSVTMAQDAPEKSKEFVEAILRSKRKKSS